MSWQHEISLGLPCRLGEWTLWRPELSVRAYRADVLGECGERMAVQELLATEPRPAACYLVDVVPQESDGRIQVNGGHWLRNCLESGTRYLINLEGTYEEYLEGFGAKTRSTLRRKLRRFAREGGGVLDLREYRTPDELAEFLGPAREVSARSYQERMFDGGIRRDAAFDEEVRERAVRGECRGYVLFLEGRPVAYLYCPLRDGVAAYVFVGYDQDYSGLSPGTVLLLAVLERLFDDPAVHAFDFTTGGGEASHKAFFANRTVERANVLLLQPTLRNRIILTAYAGSRGLSRRLAHALDRVGMKNRLRAAARRLRGAA